MWLRDRPPEWSKPANQLVSIAMEERKNRNRGPRSLTIAGGIQTGPMAPLTMSRTRIVPTATLVTAGSEGELEVLEMPWIPDDAERHTRKAATQALKELWAKVANECLERTGDEGRAIREANAVIARQADVRS